MLIIKIKGWLGNQMFQYAYIRALSLKNNGKFFIDNFRCWKFDRPYRLSIFNIKWEIAKSSQIPWYEKLWSKDKIRNTVYDIIKRFWWLLNKNHKKEKRNTPIDKFLCMEDNDFDEILMKMKWVSEWYIEWIFQTEKYFLEFKNEILNDLTFKASISKKTQKIERIIKDSESIWIHIRRWDYLQKYWLDRLWMCDIDYYTKAIDMMKAKYKNPKFFFFSDDIERCRNNFKGNDNYFIDWNTWNNDWQDMYLLHKCKNNIIWNSTFAWRWAYLNRNPKKIVICPNKRDVSNDISLKYIIPESEKWIRC